MLRAGSEVFVALVFAAVLPSCRGAGRRAEEAAGGLVPGGLPGPGDAPPVVDGHPASAEVAGSSSEASRAAAGAPAVDLEPSFRIPNGAGESLSHTPCVVFTADGKRVVTATSGGEVIVFDSGSRAILKRVRLPEEGTDAVAIDPDGRRAVWALKKGGMVVIDIDNGEVTTRAADLPADSLAISPDGGRVAVANGADLQVRALPGLEPVARVPGHAGQIRNLAWSPDARLLASAGGDGRAGVFDVAKGITVYETKKPSPLFAVAFAPGGGALAYGGEEKKVYQCDLASGREEVLTSEEQPFWITCVGYSPDGRHLAIGDESCDIWLYDVATRKRIFHNKHHVECWLGSIAWAGDNETFLFGCRPNSHAGKPGVYQLLNNVEAARSPEACQSRERLLLAIAEELKENRDPGKRQAVEAYQKALEAEGQILEAGGGQLLQQYSGPQLALSEAQFAVVPNADIPLALEGLLVEAQAPAPGAAAPAAVPSVSLESLPAALQALAKEHQETMKKQVETVNSNYCLNQWKVSKGAQR